MGLISYSEVAYYYHQRHFLFPSIVLYWRNYQKKILESLEGKEVVLSGDGRHDSMGHSAKYGTYTIFCCTIGLIIHLVVVQVVLLANNKINLFQILEHMSLTSLSKANQAGSSSAMEALGHQKAMSFLLTTGLIITTFVSDRHATIAKWMRETCPKLCKELGKPVIQHFYDLWHIGKSIKLYIYLHHDISVKIVYNSMLFLSYRDSEDHDYIGKRKRLPNPRKMEKSMRATFLLGCYIYFIWNWRS